MLSSTNIRNVKRWAKAGPEAYVVGLLGFILALLLRYALRGVLEEHLPMLLFALNSLLLAYFYGFPPSFLFLLVSLPTALFFFRKPFYAFDNLSEGDFFMVLVYFLLVGLAAYLLERLRREQYKSVLLVRVSESRYRLLIETDEDRRAAQRGRKA